MSCILQKQSRKTNFKPKITAQVYHKEQQRANQKEKIRTQKATIQKKYIEKNFLNFRKLDLVPEKTISIEVQQNRKLEKFSSTFFSSSLRGGGCGASKSEKENSKRQQAIEYQNKLPDNFLSDLVSNLNVIVSLASVASEEQQREEIMIALQWFMIMREHINTLCLDTKNTSSYDSIFEILPQILKSTVTYLRISGLLCLQVLQIANDLSRVLFTFFMTNGKRFLKVEDKEQLEELVSDFETQLDIDSSNIWVAGAEFEITMIKAVLQSAPSNSEEGKKLAISFMSGLVQSVLAMSPTDDLIQTLMDGAKFLYQAYKTQDLKKKYEVYYYFESLKWYIIQLLKCNISSQIVMQLLNDGYKKYIENSNDWLLNFCWVKMISALISYRPVISKQELAQNKFESQQKWNLLLSNKLINQLSFDKNSGRLLMFQQDQISILNQILLNFGLHQFKFFFQDLLSSLDYSHQKQFQITPKALNQPKQVDYLFQLLTETSILNECQASLTRQSLKVEGFIQQLKKDYQKQKEMQKKDEKAKNLLLKAMEANIKELIDQYFISMKLLKNIFLTYQLQFERFRLTLESINFDGKKQDDETLKLKEAVLKKIQTLSDNFEIKFKDLYLPIQDEKGKVTISLVSLEVLFSRLSVQSANSIFDDQINKHIECLTQFLNQMKEISKYHIEVTVELKGICKENEKYQKNSIKQFDLNNSLSSIENLIKTLINKNNFTLQFANYQQIFETVQNQQPQPFHKIIYYNTLRYLFTDLINQLITFKETLDELKSYIEQNKCLLLSFSIIDKVEKPNDEIECQDIVKAKLTQQLKIIKYFLFQEEKRLIDGKAVEPIQINQLLQNLKQDSQKIKDLIADPKNVPQDLKSALYAIAAVEQFLMEYLKSPAKLIQIKEQILKIYQKRNIIIQEDIIQQENFQQEKKVKLLFSQKIDNIEFQLDQLSDKVVLALENCQHILQGTIENGNFYQNLMKIELQFDFPIDNDEIDAQAYEDHENLYLNDSFAILKDLKISFLDTNIYDDQSINQLTIIISRSLEIVLYLIDQMQRKQSCSLQNDQTALTDAKQAIESLAQDANDSLNDQHYKVRQCLVISLIQIQSSQLEPNLIKFCQDNIVQIWAWEKDERVKALLKNQEVMNMQKSLFSCELKSFSKRLQQDIEERFKIVSELEQRIYLEGDPQVREKMQQTLTQEHQELEDYLDNINDMTSKLDISIQYLRDIKKSLAQLKIKIDKLQDTVNNIGEDVRRLRGKNYTELLELRKRRVMDQMQLRDINQIYIPLKCQEWNPTNGNQIGNPTILFHNDFQNQAAEINEFLHKDFKVKDVMLLRGVAGSGKSRAAVKIEEFLWQKYDSKESQWIPLYVSLPAVKEPKFNLIDQALESEFYQFDKIQIREFKEAIKSESLKILLILDSYDEMKQDCIQSNLFHTNRLSQDLFGNIRDTRKVKECLKVIITTRTEVLTSTSYQTWFQGESLESLKEVELLGFDLEQQSRYLLEYTFLSMKREILDLYYFAQEMTGGKINLEEFSSFWKKIADYLNRIQNSYQIQNDYIVSEKSVKPIIAIIKLEKCYQTISKDQIVNLEKKFLDLWSANKFEKLIESAQIQHILTTPFMMEIVVQVLPSMTKKYSDASSFKDKFIQNFIYIKQESIEEQKLILTYQNQKRKICGLQEVKIETEENEWPNVFTKLANKIWDQLQNEKYFQRFTLVDKIDQSDLQAIDDASIVIRALIVKKLTVFDFYITFVEFYHQQQMRKQLDLGKAFNIESLMMDLFNFSQSLSINMTIKQQTQIQYNSKGQLNLNFVKKQINNEDQWLDDYFNDFEQNGDYKKLVRSCILLTKKGSNHTFTHKSIQEFFVGHYLLKIFEEIDYIDENDFEIIIDSYKWENNKLVMINMPLNEPQQISITKMEQLCNYLINSLYNQNNLSLDHFKGVISLIKEEMKQHKSLRAKLIQMVKLSRLSSLFTRASSNSIFLLGQKNEYLGKTNLRKIQLSGTEILGISFYKADLEGSIFQDVRIESCNFNGANLKDARWTDIKCKEMPTIFGTNKEYINKIVFSPSGKQLMTYSNYLLFSNDLNEGKQSVLIEYEKIHCEQYFGSLYSPEFKISQLIFSPLDESLLAIYWHQAGAFDIGMEFYNSVIQLWDIKQSKTITFFPIQECTINEIAFSPDAKLLVSCNSDKNVSFFDVKDAKLIGLFQGHNGAVNSIIFSQDGKVLASGGQDKTIRIINVKDFQQSAILEGHTQGIFKLCLSTNGTLLASGSEDITIRLWDMVTFKLMSVLEGHKSKIYGMHFLADSSLIASWGKDQIILIWDAKEGKQVRSIEREHRYEIDPLCFSSDGKLLALQQNKQIQFWDVKVGKIVKIIENQAKRIQDMVFQPDENILYTVCTSTSNVLLWDGQTDKMSNNMDGHTKSVEKIIFSPDGKILASWSLDSTIRLWEVTEGKQVGIFEGLKGNLDKLEFSEDGQFILIQGLKDQINLVWYYKIEKVVQLEIEKIRKYQIVQEFIVSKQEEMLAWCIAFENNETYIQLWDVKQKKNQSLLGPLKQVKDIIFASNRILISQQDDSTVQIWDIIQKKEISRYNNVDQYECSSNGEILALFNKQKKEVQLLDVQKLSSIALINNVESSGFKLNNDFLVQTLNKDIMLWDAKTGQKLAILEGHTKNVKQLLAFSPNDQFLVSSSDDKTIRIWDMQQQKQIANFEEEANQTNGALFSQDNKVLATYNSKNNITLWDVQNQKQLSILKGHKKGIDFIVLSPDSCTMASVDDEYNLNLWDVVTGKIILHKHIKESGNKTEGTLQNTIDFSFDSLLFAYFSASQDCIYIFDIKKQEQKALIGHLDGIKKLFFSKDGLFLISQGYDQVILLWDVKEAKLLDVVENGKRERKQILISKVRQMLLVYGDSNIMRLYDPKQGKIVSQLTGHQHIIDQALFSSDGRYLASCSRDRTISLWEVKEWKQVTIFEGHAHFVNQIVFSPDCQYLISASRDKIMRLWNLRTFQQISQIQDNEVKQIVFSPDSQKIAWTNSSNLVSMVETMNFKDIIPLTIHKEQPTIFQFSPDNSLLIIYEKWKLFVWNTQSKQQVAVYDGYYPSSNKMAYQFNGNIFACLISQNEFYRIQIWNAKMNQSLQILQEHTYKILSITFSPDDKIFASCGEDGMIKLWDMSQGIYQCYKTLATYSPITAQECQISGAQIQSNKGKNLTQLFLQKGAIYQM